MKIRWVPAVVVTLISPVVAAALAGTVWLIAANFIENWPVPPMVSDLLGLTVLGTVYFGPALLAFTILTQLPLGAIQRQRGKWPAWKHAFLTGTLGAAAFAALFPDVQLSNGRLVEPISLTPQAGALIFGAFVAGAGIGVIWSLAVIRKTEANA